MEGPTDWPLNSSEVADCRDRTLTNDASCHAQEIIRLKAKLAAPGRNRSRDLQKLELLQLRVEAATLQRQVNEMQRQRAMQDVTVSHSFGIDSDSANEIRLQAWRRLATKHRKHRRETELNNEGLHQLYSNQLEICRALQKLIILGIPQKEVWTAPTGLILRYCVSVTWVNIQTTSLKIKSWRHEATDACG
ncbi:hypothetical protein V7S43_012860 [Phytophthora oleae]|uniref:Uncharacterized protein n=1 Tax=Phytophthora oleae TaxID=2107226 RepID=A0ABD3F5D0_9STRA